MAIFYDSEIDNIEQDWSAARNQPPPPEKTGYLKAAGMGVMRGGFKLAKGAALLGSLAFPGETEARDDTRIIPRREDFLRFITDPLDAGEKYFTPDPQSVGMAGQIIGGISELPLQLLGGAAGMVMSATANTGMSMIEQGVDEKTAGIAAAGSGLAAMLMAKLPQAGRNWKETGGYVLLNPLLGMGQDYALKTGLESQGYKEQAAAIDPLNPVSRIVDLTLGGLFAAHGYHTNRVNAIAKSTALEHVATRAEEYYNLAEKLGGDEGMRERLPVEVVDSLDTTRSYLKTLESNPFDRKALEGVDRHLAALNKSLADVTEGRPVDVAAHVKDLVEPAPRTLDFQTFMDKLSARFGLSPDEEAAHAGLISARARKMGMDVDEFVGKYFADVTNERPGEGALLQTGSAAELLQQRHTAQTPAEQQRAMYIDEHSGVYNARAFNAAPDTGNVSVFGFDSLKFINDTVNHHLGNDAYRVAGQALKRAGDELDIPIYRVRGDYAARLPEGEAGQIQYEQLLQRANELRDTLSFPDAAGVKAGSYDAIQLRGAMGKNIDSAHEAFTAHKVGLELAGQRPSRDQMPWGMKSGTTAERKTAHAEYGVSEQQTQHFNSMNEAERFAAVHIDPTTGLYSHAAFQALESVHNWQNDPNHVVSSIDVAGLGEVNAQSPDLADQVIQQFGERLKSISGDKVDAGRMAERGDEFALRGNVEDVKNAIKALAESLQSDTMKLRYPDGTIVNYTAKFWSMTGRNYGHADTILGILKKYERAITAEGYNSDGRPGSIGESFERQRFDQTGINDLGRENSSLLTDFIRQDAESRGLDPQPYLDKIPAGVLAELDASASAVPHQTHSSTDPLFQDAKGAVSFLSDGRAVIHALENPDFSTAVHELAHVFAKSLSPEERMGFDQWLLNYSRGKKGEWSVADHETFARAWEAYLAEGKAPTPELQTFFNNFKTWLVEIYRNIMGSPLEMKLNPDAKKAFDRLLVSETLHKEVSPEVQALRDSANAHLPEITADLHDLAGVPLPEQSAPVIKRPEPPPTPARIQRDIALQLYDDPELITRFVSDPKNIASVLAQSLEAEAGQLAGVKPETRPSLIEYLRKLGISDDRGDLASMDIDKGLKPGTRKLLRPDGVGLDKARESAMEQGYLPDGTSTADLLNLIDQEMRGNPVYPVSGDMSVPVPEWFQSILNLNRRTGKGTDTAEVAAAALRKAAAGGFDKLPAKQQDMVLAALDSINRQVQSTAREIDVHELQVGDRFMDSDLSMRTVVAERDGKLILNDGSMMDIKSTKRILGEVDQTGRPPDKGYDPLDYDVEHLLKERGDFQLSNGRDAAGNEIMVSAREFIDTAKNDAAAHDNRKHLYDLAAACMAPEF